MTKSGYQKRAVVLLECSLCVAAVSRPISSQAYERYNDGCVECHGAFTDATSTTGSVFPEGNKHVMHGREDTYMKTECDLCHTSGDARNPYTGSSNGTAANVGLGCTGCHQAEGLRAHHAINGVEDEFGDTCADCHPGDGLPPAENIKPAYYGTVDTLVDSSCNEILASDTNENWTIGDLIGLDNDGDNLYDLADFDCGPPYEVTSLQIEGNDVRISWDTVGGRRDILQAAPSLTGTFVDIGSALEIPGVGLSSTNAVELSGAGTSNRFYRIRYAP